MVAALKIIVADDHPLFREGLEQALLRIQPLFEIFQASDGEQVIEIIRSRHIDLIFLDIRMPGRNGIEITRCIRKFNTEVKIVAVSMIDDRATITKIFQAGANGYLHKNVEKCKLQQVIDMVHTGKFYLSEDFSDYEKELRTDNNFGNPSSNIHCNLSEREIEILVLICKQYSSKDIARQLHLTEKTIETHRVHLMTKTQSKNVVGLTVFAIENGYFLPGLRNSDKV